MGILKNNPAFYARRAASDAYYAISDEALKLELNMVSGVTSSGITFIGAFVEERARYQITVDESRLVVRTRNFERVDNFDKFSPEGRSVTSFFDAFSERLIAYTSLDREAREATNTEMGSAIIGAASINSSGRALQVA